MDNGEAEGDRRQAAFDSVFRRNPRLQWRRGEVETSEQSPTAVQLAHARWGTD
jgi:hypothetical protein